MIRSMSALLLAAALAAAALPSAAARAQPAVREAESDSGPVRQAREELARARAQGRQANLLGPLARLGAALLANQRAADAEPVFREQLAFARTRFPGETLPVAAAALNLADALRQAGRPREAEEQARTALAIQEKLRGPDSAEAASARYILAVALRELDRIAEAREAFERTVAAREKLFGPESRQLFGPLGQLGVLLRDETRYAEMEPALRRQLAIAERHFPGDSPERVVALSNLGSGLRHAGRFAEAEPILRRALETAENAHGSRHAAVAVAAVELGVVLHAQGRFAAAEPYVLRSIAIQEALNGPDSRTLIAPLARLGNVYREQARYAEAAQALERSVALGERAFGPADRRLAPSLTWLAVVYRLTDRLAEAEALARRAVAIREAAFGPDHQETSYAAMELAQIHLAQARFGEAEAGFRRALAVFERVRGLESADAVDMLVGLASTYRNMGRVGEALPLLDRALDIQQRSAPPDSLRTANALFMKGVALRDSNRAAEAAALLERVLAQRLAAHGEAHGSVITTLIDLAACYRNLRRLADAEAALRRALAASERLQGVESSGAANVHDQLAALLIAEGRNAEAEAHAARAAAIRERVLGPDHIRLGWSLNRLAVARFRQGRLAEALESARRTTAVYRARAVRDAGERGDTNLSERQTVRGSFIDHVGFAHAVRERVPGADGGALMAEGFEIAQLALATGTEAAVARMAARFAAGSDALAQVVKAREETLARWRAADQRLLRLSVQPAGARSAGEEARLRAELAALDAAVREHERRLATEFPDYASLATPLPLALAEVQRLLRPDEALVMWLAGSASTFVFALRRDSAAFERAAIGRGQIADAVRALRRTLDPAGLTTLADVPPFDAARAAELYRGLFAPVEALLDGARHVFVVPDGPLQSLPLGVLLTAAPQAPVTDIGGHAGLPWLARRHAMTVLPSPATLKSLRRFAGATRAREPFFGIGNPLLDGRPGDLRGAVAQLVTRSVVANVDELRKLAPLPDTADELRAMAAALHAPPSSLLLGSQASERAVRATDLTRFRIVAFATHGLMAGEFDDSGEPGLVLTPPPTASPEDDGLLTASEIAQLKLDADWVILSACNTAAPDGTPGAEGLSGLARAFFYAGSRALLVSHWAVLSDAAVRLTTDMLARSADPATGRAEAHRRAMLALMDDRERPHYAHPMFWAPFVVVGEGGLGAP